MTRRLRLVFTIALCAMSATAFAQSGAPVSRAPNVPAVRSEPVSPPETEARVTHLDGPCDGYHAGPGFRLGQDHVVRKGEIVRDFAVVLGNAVVEGAVCGDLSVTLGDVRLGPEAFVEGQLVVVGGTVTIEPGATVRGELVVVAGAVDAPADFRPGREQILVGLPMVGTQARLAVPYVTRGLLLGRLIVPDMAWVWWIVAIVFFVQALINLLFPRATASATAIIVDRPLSTFLAGLLVIVLTAPVVALLAVTVIGLAALPVLFGALVIAWIVGKIAVGRWIGSRLFEQDDPESRMEGTRSFAIGFVVLTIFAMIPVLGIVVWGLTSVLGLGAAAMAFVRGFRRENPPPVRVPPPTPPTPPPGTPYGTAAAGAVPLAAGFGDTAPLENPSAVADGFGMPPPAFAGVPPMAQATTAASAAARALLAFPRADLGPRAGAFLLDVLIVAVIASTVGGRDPDDFIVPLLLVYHVGFWLWKSTTLGGIICQLRVVRVDGAELRFVDALVRALVAIFSLGAFGLGVLAITRDPERQSWHDRVAGTFVVRVPRNYPLP